MNHAGPVYIIPLLLIHILLLIFLNGCDTTGVDLPEPGSPDYIPPEWEEPSLAYPKEAYTPSSVVEYSRAPGQFTNDSLFGIEGNTEKLLGFPRGGGTNRGGTESAVSLGMAGGYVCLSFDPPIENHPENIGGYDFIVFGNAYWTGAGDSETWREPGIIYIMKDENGNGHPDDTWYLIPGSAIDETMTPEDISYDRTEFSDSWWPGTGDTISYSGVYILPPEVFGAGSIESYGYADTAPVLLPGDLSGAVRGGENNSLSDTADYPGIDPVYFYTTPDSHETPGIDAGSGGGSSIDINWAVDPATFTPAELDEITWIKIVSSSDRREGVLGDQSSEIDAVTRVRRR